MQIDLILDIHNLGYYETMIEHLLPFAGMLALAT